jgi:hypothetical protein
MVITEQYLHDLGACQPGIDLWLTKKEAAPIRCIDQLVKISKYTYATWLIAHLLTSINAAKFAIYSAENVLSVFEAEYPDDNRPRKAMRSAKRALKNPTKENIDAALAAEYAARAAKYAARAALAAEYAARAAEYAALAARVARVAEYAARAAEYAALAAEYAARAARADLAARAARAAGYALSADPAIANKIIRYGKTLLRKQMKEKNDGR